MDEFIVVDVMNEAMIKTLKDKKGKIEENLKIKEYLKDRAFFFKISKKNALEILKKVGVREEQLENVYSKLIAESVYRNLLNSGEIKEDDEKIVIKYNNDYTNIFIFF